MRTIERHSRFLCLASEKTEIEYNYLDDHLEKLLKNNVFTKIFIPNIYEKYGESFRDALNMSSNLINCFVFLLHCVHRHLPEI
jgi:hypothetical protein